MDFFSSLVAYGSLGLLAVRIALAAIFLVHGRPKVGNPRQGVEMGFSASTWLLVGLSETIGAFLVLLGLLTQIGALLLIIVMLGALYYKLTKWHVPFSSMEKLGWEFDIIILASALVLFFLGAGGISLDRVFFGG